MIKSVAKWPNKQAAHLASNALKEMQNEYDPDGWAISTAVKYDESGKIVGVVQWIPSPEGDELLINYIASAESGKGIGTSLMRVVMQRAASANVGILLQATPEAYDFYRALGMKEKKNAYGNYFSWTAKDVKKRLGKITTAELHYDIFVIPIPRRNQFKSIPRSYATGFSPQLALDYFASRALVLKGIIDDALLNQAKLRLMEYIKGGQTANEMIGNLRSVFEPWVGDPTKIGPSGQVGIGFPPGEKAPENILMAYRLENIIRTESTTALNQGRISVGDAAGDYVIGYQFSAILDDRTTEVCQTADGLMFRKDSAESIKLIPPEHFQCRSILVFLTTDDLPVEWSTPAEIDEVVRLIPIGFK